MGTILLTIDFEDSDAPGLEGGRSARLPALTERLLALLRETRSKGTFFVVGAVAERHPRLIGDIVAEGHEVGAHTHGHTPLAGMGPDGFRADLRRTLEALDRAGAPPAAGFRAPFFSITRETAWALDVLAEEGLRYDSSIVPTSHPLYGYAGAPETPFRLSNGLWEIPLPILRGPGKRALPVAGGTYLRVLPWWLTRLALRRYFRRSVPVCVFFHPYDLDPEEPYVAVFNGPIFNRLLRIGRSTTAPKWRRLAREHRVLTIAAFLDGMGESSSPAIDLKTDE